MLVNYPNKKKNYNKPKSYSNRGMKLEDIINNTNSYYLDQNIAVIHKKPTPIQVVKIENSKIVDAYFKSPSTTDYNGIYKGKYIDFEAKETLNKASFPFSNISKHQIQHLKKTSDHGGISFIIVYFKQHEEFYLLDANIFYDYFVNNKRSIPYNDFKEKGFLINVGYFNRLNFLEVVDKIYFN